MIQNQGDHPERTVALPNRADIILIGGGHNGLTCAAYLARTGRDVLVLEVRDEPGGCASTVDAIGAPVNICNCDHTMVLASGIIADLDLAAHGLRYLDVDPVQVAVSWDESPAFVQWRSIERTLDGLSRSDPAVAVAYRRYLGVALPAARLMLAVQGSAATTPAMIAAAARRGLHGSTSVSDRLNDPQLSARGRVAGGRLPSWRGGVGVQVEARAACRPSCPVRAPGGSEAVRRHALVPACCARQRAGRCGVSPRTLGATRSWWRGGCRASPGRAA